MAKLSRLIQYFLLMLLICLGGLPSSVIANSEPPEIKYLTPDNVTNQIPYFDNRFRIDAQLDEITLLFYRKDGSPPIILIRPDGTKLKVDTVSKDRIEWFDDRTFDLIKIKKPMPGPWQALGDILPNSQIMVMSDVRIEVEPLPEIMLSGETLKVTGQLYNGEFAIDTPEFNEVITVDVDFFSTNNSIYDNFGALPIKLTTFRDDGRELDEYAKDNIFTGEFLLDFAPGEWVPVYRVTLPMATRELRQKPVLLRATPISISVEHGKDESETHKVHFDIDPTYVDPDSIIIQGTITFPDRQTHSFSILEGSGEKRIEEFEYTEPGIHRIKIGVYGKTKAGREFRLVVPEFTFNVALKSDLSVDESAEQIFDNSAELALKEVEEHAEQLALELAEQRLQEEAKQQEMMMIVIAGNVLILTIAIVGFIFYRWRKKKASNNT